MSVAAPPAPAGEGRPSAFLQDPDTVAPLPPTPSAAFWTKQLARLPFLHSVFWVVFFLAVALWGVPDSPVDSVLGLPLVPPQRYAISICSHSQRIFSGNGLGGANAGLTEQGGPESTNHPCQLILGFYGFVPFLPLLLLLASRLVSLLPA